MVRDKLRRRSLCCGVGIAIQPSAGQDHLTNAEAPLARLVSRTIQMFLPGTASCLQGLLDRLAGLCDTIVFPAALGDQP